MTLRYPETSAKRRRNRCQKKVLFHNKRELPIISPFFSNKNIYVQIIKDGRTLASVSTLEPEIKKDLGGSTASNQKTASLVGKFLAQRALQKGLKECVFDRKGKRFTGKVAELATALRGEGLMISRENK